MGHWSSQVSVSLFASAVGGIGLRAFGLSMWSGLLLRGAGNGVHVS